MKLLVTCRDLGSALSIIEIVKQGLLDEKNQIEVYAQKPAYDKFLSHGLQAHLVEFEPIHISGDSTVDELFCYCERILNEFSPDVILAGLSTPGDAGIDEAMVCVAKGRKPTFVMQDFWGEINNFFGVMADSYFCLDEKAAELTGSRYQVSTKILGSPKHAHYAKIDFVERRNILRKKLNIKNDEIVIGFFGQALHALVGYGDTLQQWAKAMSELSVPVHAAYRPHPRERAIDVLKTIEIFKKIGLNFTLLTHGESEDSLIVCDVVCSPFSNCSYDASYINYFCDIPFVVPVNLLFNKEVHQYIYKIIHTHQTPYVEMGLALNIEVQSSLKDILEFSISSEGREQVWQASKQLSNPVNSATEALSILTGVIAHDCVA